jgi:hypothetical protein
MDQQAHLLRQIRRVQSQIMQLSPYRDIGLEPNPGASREAIAIAEQRLGLSLPLSYKTFLLTHDGWPRFFEGATLLGTSSLGRRVYDDMARAVLLAAETPTAEAFTAPSGRREAEKAKLIPFGIDVQGTTVFAFELGEKRSDGECNIIAWINELGLRRESFDAFLETVLELCEAELAEQTAVLKSA